MSLEDLVAHNFEYDEQEQVNEYTASDMQWIYLNDLNQGNYANGWVNFSNLNVIGSSTEKYFDWSQGYVQVPHVCVLSCAGAANPSFGTVNGTPAYTHNGENAFGISLKGSQHIVDLLQIKFSGASVNRNSNFNNFVMNERLKMKDMSQAPLLYDILSFDWDSEDSYKIDNALGDINNQTTQTASLGLSAFQSGTFANNGMINRMRKTNYDNTTQSGSLFATNGTFTSTALNNSLQQGLVAVFDTTLASATANDANRITYLVYQFVSTIPLSEIHDFYKNLPSVQTSLGFELRMQLNIASGNSWTINCTGTNVGNHTINSVTANQSVGNTCPYIIPTPALNGSTGLRLTATNTQAFSVTASSYIGYYGNNVTLNASGVPQGSTVIPCRIFVPQINLTPSYSKMLLDSPIKTILYEDYYVDSIRNIVSTGTTQVQRLFNTQLSKVRNLYILPYLSSKANAPVSYQSILSSAPNTVSLCRLSNFNIQIGGVNVLNEPQYFVNQFYINNLLPLLAQQNGNSFKSSFMSGQINRSEWEKAYNVYSIDMRRVADEVQDAQSKAFQLTFKIDTNNTYDFLVILTYQNSLSIDRVTGQITSA